MSYVVYADVILLFNISINILLFACITILHQQRIKILHLFGWASGTGLLTFGIFLICLHTNLPYTLIYATSFFFMTFLYIKSIHCSCSMFNSISILLLCMLVMSGFLTILFHKHITLCKYIVIYPILLLVLMGIRQSIKSFFLQNTRNKNEYFIEIYASKQSIKLKGFLDTGNRLYNPYNQCPVIILNPYAAIQILPNSAKPYIEQYLHTGNYPYEIKNEKNLFPLPYKTISSSFALMPAFRIDKLVFAESKKTYTNLTAAISQKNFMDKCDYQVLLHESLKPI